MNQSDITALKSKKKKKKSSKSRLIIFLLILGIIITSTVLIPSPGSTLYYNNGNLKSITLEDGTQVVYYPSGNKKYNGQIVDGFYHGEGRYYDESGNIIYDGQWEKGVINGHGTEYYKCGTVKYQGTWKKGHYHGEGTKFSNSEIILYHGEWYYGVSMGYGEMYDDNGDITYKGQLVNGAPHGQGEKFINGNLHYDGLWYQGDYYTNYTDFYLPDGTKLSPALGRYYQDLITSLGFEEAVYTITNVVPHMNIVEEATADDYFKYLMYQHLELPSTYNNFTITAIIKEFESIPISIFEDLVELGVKHRFVHGSIANQPEFSDINESSRGVSLSIASGISSPKNKLIITRLDQGVPPATAVHELGHAVDFFLLGYISDTDEFEEIRKSEAATMFNNRYYDTQYFIDYPEEYFAEFFAQYFLSDDLRMLGGAKNIDEVRHRAPKTSEFMETHVVPYQSQHLPLPEIKPQLAAEVNLPISLSMDEINQDSVTLSIDNAPTNNDFYFISSKSSLNELTEIFAMSQEDIVELLYHDSYKLADTETIVHDQSYIIYLIVDQEGNYAIGETDKIFPPEVYFEVTEIDPFQISTDQALIIGIVGKLKNTILK